MERNVLKSRESNFELMRIFAMFLIILSHCLCHGIASYWNNNISILDHINNFFMITMCSGGQIGVSLFILLCGYFSCQKELKISKWFTIYLKTLFISLFIFLLFFFINPLLAIAGARMSLTPFTGNAYWFVSTYLLLLIFIPFLNTLLQKFPIEKIKLYLVWSIIVLIIFPSFLKFDIAFSKFLYFMFLYVLGGCLKLKYISLNNKIFTYFFWFSTLLFCISIFNKIFEAENYINLWNYLFLYTSINSPYILIASLYLFRLFSKLHFSSDWINWLAKSMFGVYLLHDNNFVRPYLWHILLDTSRTMQSFLFIFWILLISICVLGLFIVLDKILSIIYIPFIETTISISKKIFNKLKCKTNL